MLEVGFRVKQDGPKNCPASSFFSLPTSLFSLPNMVGPSGFEPPASRLSGVRSNRLSYGPLLVSPHTSNNKIKQNRTHVGSSLHTLYLPFFERTNSKVRPNFVGTFQASGFCASLARNLLTLREEFWFAGFGEKRLLNPVRPRGESRGEHGGSPPAPGHGGPKAGNWIRPEGRTAGLTRELDFSSKPISLSYP